MDKVSIDLLRSYTGQKVTKLIVGQVVQYDGKYWIVESTDMVEPLRLTAIRSDNSRAPLEIEG